MNNRWSVRSEYRVICYEYELITILTYGRKMRLSNRKWRVSPESLTSGVLAVIQHAVVLVGATKKEARKVRVTRRRFFRESPARWRRSRRADLVAWESAGTGSRPSNTSYLRVSTATRIYERLLEDSPLLLSRYCACWLCETGAILPVPYIPVVASRLSSTPCNHRWSMAFYLFSLFPPLSTRKTPSTPSSSFLRPLCTFHVFSLSI